jgi:hypothetical protein
MPASRSASTCTDMETLYSLHRQGIETADASP